MTTTAPLTDEEISSELDTLSLDELKELHEKIESMMEQEGEAYKTFTEEIATIDAEATTEFAKLEAELQALEIQAQKEIEELAKAQALESLHSDPYRVGGDG